MQTVVGIFESTHQADSAATKIREADSRIELSLLTPASRARTAASVPTTETEQEGMGKAMGGVVGGALGAASGLTLGAAVASVLLPGVGAVAAFGIAGAALLGAAGVVGGAIAGEELEHAMSRGLPVDELFIYEDALRDGHSVLFAFQETDEQSNLARRIMKDFNAEEVDEAKERWWLGMREAEKEYYEHDEEYIYRRGFEAALHPASRGKSFEDAHKRFGDTQIPDLENKTYRTGFERGQKYYRGLLEQDR